MFIERKKDLHKILSLHERAVAGRGGIALICGEAGIGKTSLLLAMRERIDGDHAVYWGGCEALFTPRPLGPLRDMEGRFTEDIRAMMQNGGRSTKLFSEISDSFEKGAVLIVEDIHWADFATLDFLRFIGRRVSEIPILVIVSFRPDELEDDGKVRKIVDRFPASFTFRIDLKPLSKSGVRKLCLAAGIKEHSAQYHEISGGNPFFVNELIASEESPGGAIPASIKEAVNTRLLRLSPQEREFLEVLSVLPGAIPKPILEPIFGDQGDLFAMAALGRKLLTEADSGSLRFRHELARLATLARVPATRQRKIHETVLNALVSIDEYSSAHDQFVHHAAGALNAEMVLKYAPLAAETTAAVGAHQEAAAHLHTAMQFVDEASSEQAAEIYEKWAYEAGLSLRIDDDVIEARRHAVTLWRALGEDARVAENLRWLSRLHWYRAESAEATRYADEAVRILEDTPPSAERAKAYSLKSQLYMLNDEMAEAIEWGEKALKLASKFDDTEIRIHALNNVGVARCFRGYAAGVAMLEESLSLALEHGFHEHAARVYTNFSEYAVEFKEFDLAERIVSQGVAFDTKNDLDSWTHYLVGRQAQLRCAQGRLHDAKTICEGVLELDRLTLLMKLPARLVLSRVKTLMGDKDAASNLADVLDHASATEEPQHIVPAQLNRLLFAWLNNAPRIAEESLYALFDIGADAMHMWHRGEIAAWANRFGYETPSAFCENIAEPYQLELTGKVKKSAALWRKIGAPVDEAIALIRAKKPELLATALKIARKIDARSLEEKILAQAGEHGLADELPRKRRGPYQASRNHPLGLTQKEQIVLSLLVDGNSNPEIAEIMSRSKRTVENHMSSILKKLNVDNRMDAIVLVQSEPWLLPDNNNNK
ncbi:helix-turn-helix transcriptional regulator [Hyphococcus sp.]|uniref:helix-turn-helix transcriptional regulator n=1 Tax=Hyphococcus sp. TaxID=2038636 RepID=UPI003CCC3AFD